MEKYFWPKHGIEEKKLMVTTQSGPVHTRPEEFENATIIGHFEFAFEETSSREIT